MVLGLELPPVQVWDASASHGAVPMEALPVATPDLTGKLRLVPARSSLSLPLASAVRIGCSNLLLLVASVVLVNKLPVSLPLAVAA
jgi:hypothetical protein